MASSAHETFCDDVVESVRLMAAPAPGHMKALNIDWTKVKAAASAAATFYLNAVPVLDATFPSYRVFVDGAAAAIAVAMGVTAAPATDPAA